MEYPVFNHYLIYVINIMSAERPHGIAPSAVQCNICHEWQSSPGSLRPHKSRMHPTCNLCQNGTPFQSKKNLLNHKINAHGNNASKRIKFSGLYTLANAANENSNKENRSRSPRRNTKNNKNNKKKGGYRKTRRH